MDNKNMKRGFTLIEALAVIAIIGTLATLTTYVLANAQRSARDAKRKADVVAISEGFEARYADKTCSNGAYTNHFPGEITLARDGDGKFVWGKVSLLGTENLCDSFSAYLPTVPTDPKSSTGRDYYYNISQDAKHYRIATSLEKLLKDSEIAELNGQSDIWSSNFTGQPYDKFSSSSVCTHAVDQSNQTVCYNFYQGR